MTKQGLFALMAWFWVAAAFGLYLYQFVDLLPHILSALRLS